MSVLRVEDKYSGKVLFEIPMDSRAELRRKISLARQAKDQVRRLSLEERAELIKRVGKRIAAARDEFVQLLLHEAGQPRKWAEYEVARTIVLAENFGTLIDLVRPREVPAVTGKNLELHEPFGVAGVIAPRNTPLLVPFYTMFSALGAGNAVIEKPSNVAPSPCHRLVAFAREEGFPAEAVQVSTCSSTEAAWEFVENPEVDVFVTYSSTPVGKDNIIKIGQYMQGTKRDEHNFFCVSGKMKKYVPELAGNDPFIVLAGADPERAAEAAVHGGFANSGQLCISAKRLLVHRSLAERFTEVAAAGAARLKLGSPLDPDADIGPLGRQETIDQALFEIKDGLTKGGRLVFGGSGKEPFFEPTLIEFDKQAILGRRRSEKPVLWVEESFGPVRSVVTYDTWGEAVTLANDTTYGLGAAIFGQPEEALRMAAELNCGRVIVNESPLYSDLFLPVGGIKDSGLYGSTHKILEMTYLKRVHLGP